ncbi:MAG: hypothetical protein ACYC6Y_24320 [Thermoguttaceae bacterium]
MNRDDVVGRKITRLMRDTVTTESAPPAVAGISGDVRQFFHVYLELDGRDVMEVGLDRRYYPLEYAPADIRDHLTDVTFPECVRGCIGDFITDVMTLYEQIIIRLSSGRYFWVEDSLHGTEICLDRPEDVPEEALVGYWRCKESGSRDTIDNS